MKQHGTFIPFNFYFYSFRQTLSNAYITRKQNKTDHLCKTLQIYSQENASFWFLHIGSYRFYTRFHSLPYVWHVKVWHTNPANVRLQNAAAQQLNHTGCVDEQGNLALGQVLSVHFFTSKNFLIAWTGCAERVFWEIAVISTVGLIEPGLNTLHGLNLLLLLH